MRRVLVTLIPPLVAACFDWNVASSDGGSDATIDAPVEASSDAAKDVIDDGPPPPEAGSTCGTLTTDLATKRATALACASQGDTCLLLGVDECGCEVAVIDPSATASKDYGDAITQFAEAGCSCGPTSCPAPDASWTCLPSGDASACAPQ